MGNPKEVGSTERGTRARLIPSTFSQEGVISKGVAPSTILSWDTTKTTLSR